MDRSSAETAIDTIDYDDQCIICRDLAYKPVKTQCSHLMCASCAEEWSNYRMLLTPASPDAHLARFDPEYDPSQDFEVECPMCRRISTVRPDKDCVARLEAKYPVAYAARKEQEDPNSAPVETLNIFFGNTHQTNNDPDDPNIHDWTIFVDISIPDLIHEVHFRVDDGNTLNEFVIREAPFEVRRQSIGPCYVTAGIVFHGSNDPTEGVTTDYLFHYTWRLVVSHNRAQTRLRLPALDLENTDFDSAFTFSDEDEASNHTEASVAENGNLDVHNDVL